MGVFLNCTFVRQVDMIQQNNEDRNTPKQINPRSSFLQELNDVKKDYFERLESNH